MDYIVLPSFPELKKEMDRLKDITKLNKKYAKDIEDIYLCEDCSIYLLYKNVNKHYNSRSHICNSKITTPKSHKRLSNG